jgi:hypothetical protein
VVLHQADKEKAAPLVRNVSFAYGVLSNNTVHSVFAGFSVTLMFCSRVSQLRVGI